MSEIVVFGGLGCAIWGFIDIARRIRRFVMHEEPKMKNQPLIKLSKDETASLMMQRADNGDKKAEDWLVRHGYEQNGGKN